MPTRPGSNVDALSACMRGAGDLPSAWVTRFIPLIPRGEVLDLACGSGRHSRLLAAHGYRVMAVDRDTAALDAICDSAITIQEIDLETGAAWPFAADRFAGIVVVNYLHRPLLASMLQSVAPGGVLIYETFAQGNERFSKPANPDFLLQPGELLDVLRNSAASRWRIVAFEDGYQDQPKPAMVQRICAIKASSAEISPGHIRI